MSRWCKLERYEEFKKQAAAVAEQFRNLSSQKVRIVSHLDADGISACAILIHALDRENIRHTSSIVHQVDEPLLEKISRDSCSVVVFCDIGSGQLSLISARLKGKKIFVFDHHNPERMAAENITHLNPHIFGIDGSKEISGAGVVYFFARALNDSNRDLAHIAIIGAIGDIQENKGFLKLNEEILEDAKKAKKMKVIKGLRVFGAQTKPLHKVLEYSTEYNIPGVTGSESQAIQFLNQIGINPKNGNEWKKLVNLSDDEIKTLTAEIVMKRIGEKKPEDFIGPVYLLTEEKKRIPAA